MKQKTHVRDLRKDECIHATDMSDKLQLVAGLLSSGINVLPLHETFSYWTDDLVFYPKLNVVGNLTTAINNEDTIYALDQISFESRLDHYSERLIVFHTTFDSPVLPTPQIPEKQRALLRVSLLQEELNELREAIEANDLVECADALVDLQVVLEGSFAEFGMQHLKREMFDEVMDSNMSKLDDDGLPIINGEKGVIDVTRPKGKILKSKNFFEPDLRKFLI